MDNPGQDPSLGASPPVQEQQLSVAQQLGLPEYVNVQRSSGYLEGGWVPTAIEQKTDPQTQQLRDYVRVESEAANGYKWVTPEELQGWNPTDAEDTIPRDKLQDLLNSVRPEAEAAPEPLTEEEVVAEEVGEVAVEGAEGELIADSSLEDDDETVDAEPEPTPEAVPESASPDESEPVAEVEPEQKPPEPESAPDPEQQQRVVNELIDVWGFPEGTTPETALNYLDAENTRLSGLLKILTEFSPRRETVMAHIKQTRYENRIVYVSIADRQALQQFAEQDIRRMNHLMQPQQHLPPKLGSLIELLVRQAGQIHGFLDDFLTRNPNGINMNLEPQMNRFLGQTLPELAETARTTQIHVNEMEERLGFYRKQARSPEQAQEVQYRNDQVKAWAKELKGEVTPERLAEITQQMENYVRIETGMIDDPNSPQVWFGDRVKGIETKDYGTLTKARHSASVKLGRPEQNISSLTSVAELMADILRGKFDQQAAKSDAIVLDPKKSGGVSVGQHRVAALAMLYGKDWQAIAKKQGFEIKSS